MRQLFVRAAVTLWLLALGLLPAAAAGKLPFTLIAQRAPQGSLALVFTIDSGSYLYKDKLHITGAGGRSLSPHLPPAETKNDPNFGLTEIYHDQLVATLDAAALGGESSLRVTFQGCAERGVCYAPKTLDVDVASLAVGGDRIPAAPSAAKKTWQSTPPAAIADNAPPAFLNGSWAGLALSFVGFGLLLAFTPCVFPMIPILIGMLSQAGEERPAARGFSLSLVYVLAMASAYGLLGVVAAWSGQNLQVALQTPAALGAMAAVFVLLALASFGVFALRLPTALTDRVTGYGVGSRRHLGAAVLGFTSALIVGPCVTPPLAAALIYVAQTGDAARGAFALFALGLGMGLPLIVVGTLGSGVLPRSGAWLLVTNRLFGVVFLAIAVTLLGRFLPPAPIMALWAALAVGGGVFLGAFDAIGPSDGAPLRLRKAAGLIAVTYGGTLVVGATAGADDPTRPLAFATRPQPVIARADVPTTVRSVAELNAVLAQARGDARPVLVTFSADWCSSCKTMEREVFADPAITERLRALRVIQADVTAPGQDSAALMKRFDVVGPPTLIFIDPHNGREITGARSTGEISADELRHLLDRLAA